MLETWPGLKSVLHFWKVSYAACLRYLHTVGVFSDYIKHTSFSGISLKMFTFPVLYVALFISKSGVYVLLWVYVSYRACFMPVSVDIFYNLG